MKKDGHFYGWIAGLLVVGAVVFIASHGGTLKVGSTDIAAAADVPVYQQPTNRTWIKIYTSAAAPSTPEQGTWLAEHVDLGVISNTLAATSIANPIRYMTFSDMYGAVLRDTLNELSQKYASVNKPMDNLFLHYSTDTQIPLTPPYPPTAATEVGVTKKSYREDRFSGVFTVTSNDTTPVVTDVTYQTYGDPAVTAVPKTYDTPVGNVTGDQFFVGDFFIFDEMNFRFSAAAPAGWKGTWEYWNGTVWKPLTATDTTNGMKQGGKISFVPPADWKKSGAVNYKGKDQMMYWARLTVENTAATGPVIRATEKYYGTYNWEGTSGLYSRAYKQVAGTNGALFAVVPGWNAANDKNGNGYVDATEFATRVDKTASARFKDEARVPSMYMMNRWVTYLGDPTYAAFAGQQAMTTIIQSGVKGIMIDNLMGVLYDQLKGAGKYVEYPNGTPATNNSNYAYHSGTFLKAVKAAIGSNILQTNATYEAPQPITDNSDGVQWEGIFKQFANGRENDPAFFTTFTNKIKALKAKGKYVVLTDSRINVLTGKGIDPKIPYERDAMYDLAKYYVVADDNTYWNFSNNLNYSYPWNDWLKAAEYNIGNPAPSFTVFKSAVVGGKQTYVLARAYGGALVLLRPMMEINGDWSDATGLTLTLPGMFSRLDADGTLHTPASTVTLRAYEGAILIKAAGAPATPPATQSLTVTPRSGNLPFTVTASIVGRNNNAVNWGDGSAPGLFTLQNSTTNVYMSTHTYTQAGNYTVVLNQLGNPVGQATVTAIGASTPPPPPPPPTDPAPTPDPGPTPNIPNTLNIVPTSGTIPFTTTVTITGRSNNAVDWGDGSAPGLFTLVSGNTYTSTHTYAKTGNYFPKLLQLSVPVAQKQVTAISPLVVTPTSGKYPLTVTFSIPGRNNNDIDFGDGTSGLFVAKAGGGYSVVHTYNSAGTYIAKLRQLGVPVAQTAITVNPIVVQI